jgi:hypothetical protein
MVSRILLSLAVLVSLAGCADLKVNLQYAPAAKIESLTTGVPVTVFRFADARGGEGDKGDVYRVGGVYNGYGMRLAKILSPTPWPEALVHDLESAFTDRGVKTVLVENRVYEKGAAVTTPLVLTERSTTSPRRTAGPAISPTSAGSSAFTTSQAPSSPRNLSPRAFAPLTTS